VKHLDLFSGIGGFAYAADQVWDNVEHVFCDNDKFCQQVITKHWPEAKQYNDIQEITEEQADIVTGGFPCQPFSHAGKRRGTDDDRYLWPEMLRVIRLAKPQWVIAENVSGLITMQDGLVFEQVCLDLEAEGYEVQPFIIPAIAVNAPHKRDRVWFVAHANSSSNRRGQRQVSKENSVQKISGQKVDARQSDRATGLYDPTDPKHLRCKGSVNQPLQRQSNESWKSERSAERWATGWPISEPRTVGVDDGIPNRTHRIKSLGNAIVPQVAIEIMRGIVMTIQSSPPNNDKGEA
jgi:DNA (cytosine-5)-methyltransferase 1